MLVRIMLEMRGIACTAHTMQDRVLAELRTGPSLFGLMVIDYNMPGMSGLDVACEVRTIRPDLPVVLMSGYVDEKMRAQARASGVSHLMLKADSVQDMCDELVKMVRPDPPRSVS